MYLSSSMPMFLQLLVASHDPVYRNCLCEFKNDLNLMKLDNFNRIVDEKFNLKTIENFDFMLLDTKKWRIVLIFVVYKSDDL